MQDLPYTTAQCIPPDHGPEHGHLGLQLSLHPVEVFQRATFEPLFTFPDFPRKQETVCDTFAEDGCSNSLDLGPQPGLLVFLFE